MPASRDVIFRLLGEDLTSPAFNKAAASAEGAAARISRSGEKIGAAGRKLTHTVTLPVIALGVAAIKTATDFNSSMTRIQTQAGASARDVQYLSKQVLGMRNVQQGPNELAGALYHLKSVGMGNVQAMRALRVGSDLAAVGHANLEETVNALAGAWRTGIRGAKDFHDAAATVNAVIGAGNMTLEDFTAALGTGILPSAKTFGLTLKDVGSALALFTDEGVPADAAATRLRMTFSLLGAPSQAAEKQLKKIGLTGLTLANDMRKPNGLIRAVGDLKAHLEDPKYKLSLSEQAQLLSRAFGGGRSSSAILSMINNFDVLQKKQDQVTRSLGRYDQAVKAQRETPEAVFKTRIANLERTATTVGTKLLPFAVEAVQTLGTITGSVAGDFDKLSGGQKRLVIEAGLAVVALGPVLTIVGRLGKVAGAVAKAAAFMAAPYRKTAAQAQLASMQVQVAEMEQQAAAQRASAIIAVAEAEKANATAEAAVSIAASLEGTNSVLAADSTMAAENAIEFAAAQQAKADAAVRSAAEITVATGQAQVAMRNQMANTQRSVYGLQTAITGLGIGLTVGAFTRGASTSTKLMGSLGAAGAGAAIGWSMGGGPWGAAIGGLVGGLSSLASAFIGTGHSASKASVEAQRALALQQQAADDLLGTLKQVGGQYGKNYRTQLVADLQKSGIYNHAQRLGVNPYLVTQYAEGKNSVLPKILRRLYAENIPASSIDDFLTELTKSTGAGGDAERRYQQFLAAQGIGLVPRKRLGLGNLRKELVPGATGLNVKAQEVNKIGSLITFPADTSAAARRNTALIRENLQWIVRNADAEVRHGKSIQSVTKEYHHQINALRDYLLKQHFNKQQIDDLIKSDGTLSSSLSTILAQWKNWPQHVSTRIDVKTGDVVTRLDDVITRLHTIGHGANATVSITSVNTKTGARNTVHAQAAGTRSTFGRATIPPNTTFTVGEGGSPWSWEGGMTDSLGRASIFSNAQSRAMGFKAPTPYARGTGRGGPLNVRVYIGDRDITDIVRTEVDEQLSFDAGRARARG